MSISRTLKDCGDLELFEKDAIKHIIDYKWATYTRNFFLLKFLLFFIFLVFFYIDVEYAMTVKTEEGHRLKDHLFLGNKIICSTIQLIFFSYEVVQIVTERGEYFKDVWNYLEVLLFAFFIWATVRDIVID